MANIKLTLKNPDYCDYAFDDKILVGKSISGKTLEVVYSKIRNKILVITVYYS